MRISAIIPTLNDVQRLGACLAGLQEADEIIISDGGSSDGTVPLAREVGARIVVGPPGLGAQLARGAEAAVHPGLLFVPPGTTLDAPAVWRARKHLNRSLRPGCFWLCIDEETRRARWVERAVDWRTRVLQLPTLAQGLAVRKDRYREAGGYRPLPLLEHEDLLHRLPPVIQLPDDAVVAGERMRRDGYLGRSGRAMLQLALWHAGASPERVAALTGAHAGRGLRRTAGIHPAE